MDEIFGTDPDLPVLVIGAAGVDIVGRLRGELRQGTSNSARIRYSFGGVARNVAENLARLGQPVRLLSAVGHDESGARLLEQARSAGVIVDCMLQVEEITTNSYLGILSNKAELLLALDDMRAVSALTPAYLKDHEEVFREASLLFIDANLPRDTMRTAFSLARKAGLPVCADPTTASLAHRLKRFLPRVAVITPNVAEAEVLTELTINPSRHGEAVDAAKRLVSAGVDVAIIALGEHGVCYATSETSGRLPAIRTEVVDPTGAGDAMTAAVLFALLNNIPVDEAVRLGVSAAALTLRHSGAVYPKLSLQELYDQLVI